MFNYLTRKAEAMALCALELAMTPILLPIVIVFEAANVYNTAHEREVVKWKEIVTKQLGEANFFVHFHRDFTERVLDLCHPMYFAPLARISTEESITFFKGCCSFCHQTFAKSEEQLEWLKARYRHQIKASLLKIMNCEEFKLLQMEYDDVTFSFNKGLNRIELSQCGPQLGEEVIHELNQIGFSSIDSFMHEHVIVNMVEKCPICCEKMYKWVYNCRGRLVLKICGNKKVRFLGVQIDPNYGELENTHSTDKGQIGSEGEELSPSKQQQEIPIAESIMIPDVSSRTSPSAQNRRGLKKYSTDEPTSKENRRIERQSTS